MVKIVSEKLNIINKKNGSIFPILKSTSEFFVDFGEVYISSLDTGVTRAWKKHKSLNQYFVVPIGEVKFVFLVDEKKGKNKFKEIIIGESNYSFIKVPSNVWYGFSNICSNTSYVVNVIDLPHSEGNSESRDYKDSPLEGYSW